MKDEAEQSIPSRGSHGSPVAWSLMQPDSYSVFASRMLAEKMQELRAGGEVVPLYSQPQPSLTGKEREAVAYYIGTGGPDGVDSTLRALLERLG
jgi:hypothetical protein